jgi:hypothetical protein
MPTFGLEVIPARQGDCLILHYGKPGQPRLSLIDGGPNGVYGSGLKKKIAALRRERGLEDVEPLPVDILMISHVDADHIAGILQMTDEMKTTKAAMGPPVLRLGSLWHNSFPDILGAPLETLPRASLTASLGGDEGSADEHDHDLSLILAGVGQGADLRDDAKVLGWRLNAQFDGGLICAEVQPTVVKLGDDPDHPDLTLTVVGPALAELKALWKEHQKWVKEQQEKQKTAKERAKLQAYVDEAVANLSSIVVLAETPEGSVLLTGDARGDMVIEGLRACGRLKDDGPLEVDILKVPHHGSANNLDDDFFKLIVARHYVFTGNGEYGNPEREAFEMLLRARPGAAYTLHLSYPIAGIDIERKKDWVKQRARQQAKYDKATPAKRAKMTVRPEWSDADHSLAALFAGLAASNPEIILKTLALGQFDLVTPD